VIDLSATTPTKLPELFREAAKEALGMSSDPLNSLDDNPFIGREWLAVSHVLWSAAASLDAALARVFDVAEEKKP
jgi:hypothetical protein